MAERVVFMVLFLVTTTQAQPYISLKTQPDSTSAGEVPLCPNMTNSVQITCKGVDLTFIGWFVNGRRIADFQLGANVQLQPVDTIKPGFTVQLVSVIQSTNMFTGNFTSTLNANVSVLHNNNVISCGDNRGNKSLMISYTIRSSPPVPVYIHIIGEFRNHMTLSVLISWNDTFTSIYSVDKYIVTVTNNVSCSTDCGDPNTSCTCIGPEDFNFTVKAINCGDQEGPASIPIMVTSRAIMCSVHSLGHIPDDQLSDHCNSTNNIGSVTISNGRACYTGTTAGSVVTYQCDNGYVMTSGSEQRMCRSDGNWDGEIPHCILTTVTLSTVLSNEVVLAIAVATTFVVAFLLGAITAGSLKKCRCKQESNSVKSREKVMNPVKQVPEAEYDEVGNNYMRTAVDLGMQKNLSYGYPHIISDQQGIELQLQTQDQ